MEEALLNIKKAALGLGATEAKIILTREMVIERRVVLKCRYWCNEYGRNWSCPPYVPSVDEFRKLSREYEYALIVNFQSPSRPEIWSEKKREAHLALLKLEKIAFESGFPFALLLRPGSCNICSQCDITKPCRHPELLRFSPEAVGVNLIETLKKAGISLKFPVTGLEEKINIIAILLIH